MKQFLNIALAVVLALVAGCATPSNDAAQNSGPTETCHVCRYNNDLGCVNIRVKDATPRTEYQGDTHYFCSEDCLETFLKNPARYLPALGR